MTLSASVDGHVRMSEAEFEELLARSVARGAKRALADLGLEGADAAGDIHNLRPLLDASA